MVNLGKTEKNILIEILNGNNTNKKLSKKLKVKSVQDSLTSLMKKRLIERYKDYIAYGVENPKLERFYTYKLTLKGVNSYEQIKQKSILQYKLWLNKHYSDPKFKKDMLKSYKKSGWIGGI